MGGTGHIGGRRRDRVAALGVLVLLAAAAPWVRAETPAAAAARTVLETHCARCHQTGRLENPPAKGQLGNVLDVDALARRDDLIVPSDPDSSRLYQVMLARHRPLSVFFGPVPGPTPAEIGAVRDWLSSLPSHQAGCPDRKPLTAEDTNRDVAAWRKAFERDSAKPLRFISLANLHNLCRSDAALAAYRDAVATLLARLTLRSVTALDTVGEANALLAFQPADLGLTAEAWDLRAGGSTAGVVEAEELAARANAATATATAAAAPGGLTSINPVSRASAASAPAKLIDGLDPVDALALEHTRTVSMHRAAVELRLPEADLGSRLAALTGDDRILALRLAQTGLPRAEWEKLKARLDNRPAKTAPEAASPERLHLDMWANDVAYKAGDLFTVSARASGDCNLTLIAVEADGVATVLFPNDSTQNNRISAGTTVQIPEEGAPFQLRLDKAGRHTIVAICNAAGRRPQGIGHDFERQRFTVLGDWRTFLLETVEREAAYQKTQDDLRKFRTGAGSADQLEEELPLSTEEEARAAFSVEIR